MSIVRIFWTRVDRRVPALAAIWFTLSAFELTLSALEPSLTDF